VFECTFYLTPLNPGFASPRIIPTSPVVVRFAINSTIQSSRVAILPFLHNANANPLANMHLHSQAPRLDSGRATLAAPLRRALCCMAKGRGPRIKLFYQRVLLAAHDLEARQGAVAALAHVHDTALGVARAPEPLYVVTSRRRATYQFSTRRAYVRPVSCSWLAYVSQALRLSFSSGDPKVASYPRATCSRAKDSWRTPSPRRAQGSWRTSSPRRARRRRRRSRHKVGSALVDGHHALRLRTHGHQLLLAVRSVYPPARTSASSTETMP
jgi:hypothetical protein